MAKRTDVRVQDVSLYFLPVQTRMPLKFGPETLTSVTCVRVCMTVRDREGNTATGWGETPLSVQWVWPSPLSYRKRHDALKDFCLTLGEAWAGFGALGHPIEVGKAFQDYVLPDLLAETNARRGEGAGAMPWLAALVCCSAFDLALHDAYGVLHGVPIYDTYDAAFMNCDLSDLLEPAEDSGVSFVGRYPADLMVDDPPERLPAWHLVGGVDPLDKGDLDRSEPDDGYPVLLREWIARDGLRCLKIKLQGTDATWDYRRLVRVGQIGMEEGVLWLTSDFNCTVTDPQYVTDILDRLMAEHPRIYGMLLYVEQPFPYGLARHRIDAHAVSARKPLFMDESAHNWELIRLGRRLGWTGVALKTCKTQTEAILSLCWARAHGMTLMVQDLTNPMLAQIPHVSLAAHAGTIMGVETNAMQFYPQASEPEAAVHPGLYRRRDGEVDLSTIRGPGFGYRLAEIDRRLPAPTATFGGGSIAPI